MSQFIRAHGNTPGPIERPWMAGALSGVLGAIPAAAMLWMTGALANLSEAIRVPFWLALLLQVSTMGIVGAVYGRVFNRAATDWRGSWLFGISYGFLVWMLGPVMIIQWSIGRPIARGPPAMGLFAAHVLWGLVLGLLFPWLHSTLQHHSRGGPFGLE